MRKIFIMLALCMTATFAYADQVTDAIRTFYAKGSYINIEVSMDTKEVGSGAFSVFMDKSAAQKISYIKGIDMFGIFGNEATDALIVGTGIISMRYISSVKNDANGNLIITTKTLTDADTKNGDFEALFLLLFSDTMLSSLLN